MPKSLNFARPTQTLLALLLCTTGSGALLPPAQAVSAHARLSLKAQPGWSSPCSARLSCVPAPRQPASPA